ncbi:MAG: cyclase family protein [Bacteroidetes bacterium]|nr:cyclase family protein [Bacteroidota bacterium]
MITTITHKGNKFELNLSQPIDISIPLRSGEENVNAWYCSPVKIEPVVMGDWVGDVNQGGSVNFRNVFLNPHGNGTHTECVGHISKENYSLNQHLKLFMFIAQVISVTPEKINDDLVITKKQLETLLTFDHLEAIVIRTLPNKKEKNNHHYSNTNPPYLHHEAAGWLAEMGVQHLLLDLPSVDREQDEGKLLAHHAFWKYPFATRLDCTITELIFVDEKIKDGWYLLNLQITSLENDASPSKPVLYSLTKVE